MSDPLAAVGLWGLGTRGSGMEDGDSGTGSGGGRLTAPGFRLLAPGYPLSAIGFPLWAIGSHFLILQPRVPSPQSPIPNAGFRLSASGCCLLAPDALFPSL